MTSQQFTSIGQEIDRRIAAEAAAAPAPAAQPAAPAPAASITTHNGIFTVTSRASGEHRTFRVKTQKPDAKFAPGERIVSLLTGPVNTNDYTSFGILKADGHIVIWKKHRETQFEKLARMLERLDEHAALGHVTVQASTTCRVCNRLLSDPISIATGIGPICGGRE